MYIDKALPILIKLDEHYKSYGNNNFASTGIRGTNYILSSMLCIHAVAYPVGEVAQPTHHTPPFGSQITFLR